MLKFFKRMGLVIGLCFWVVLAQAGNGAQPIRIAMTPAFLHDQHAMLAQWRDYLETHMKRPVEFIQRDRYRETIDLLQQQKVDFAWICDYPYLVLKKDVKLLAVALHHGQPSYQSYLIVPSSDITTRSIADLKNTIFAFADPYSNTGYLSPGSRSSAVDQNQAPFSNGLFSHGHTAR